MLKMEKDESLEKFSVEEEESFSNGGSGFQSGWTLYLATSTSLPPTKDSSAHEQGEEDLSMLSDASSGPPHINKDDYLDCCYCSNVEDDCISSSPFLPVTTFAKNEANKLKQRRNLEDDTASSNVYFSKDVEKVRVEDAMELSYGFSVNHLKKRRQEGERKPGLKKER